MRRAALIAAIGLFASAVPALAQPNVGAFFVRGSVGFATQSLEDWNDNIDGTEQILQDAGVPANFEDFGGGVPFGFEAGYQVNPMVGVSLGVFRQSDNADNTFSDVTGSLTTNSKVALTSVTGAVSLWAPSAPGLFFGADLGVGFGTAEMEFRFRDFADPTNDLDITGDWSGNGLVGGVFAGYQREFNGGFFVHGRLGYQFQNLGELDGDLTSPQLGSLSGPPQNLFTGQNMDTDFSGVQLLFGIGMAFGTQ